MSKLSDLQLELKAPKSQRNTFGNYNYRNCEDILEAVKPLLAKYDLTLTLSDELVNIGDRYYVKATAELVGDTGKAVTTATSTAYAREEETKKGMDGAQITGAASSYARKYALNGLFLIDDTKDADATNDHGKAPAAPQKPVAAPIEPPKPVEPPLTEAQVTELLGAAKLKGMTTRTQAIDFLNLHAEAEDFTKLPQSKFTWLKDRVVKDGWQHDYL